MDVRLSSRSIETSGLNPALQNLKIVGVFISTPRLILRPLALEDAPALQRLLDDPEIVRMTLRMPHPFPLDVAIRIVTDAIDQFAGGRGVTLGLTLKENGELIGVFGLKVERLFNRAELGYWLGSAWWGKGYATEAARALVDWGFQNLSLNRIYALCHSDNRGSVRVLQKIGLKLEGVARQHVKKEEKYSDEFIYGILESEWRDRRLT